MHFLPLDYLPNSIVLPPHAFLDPELFRTQFDLIPANAGLGAQRYAEGLEIGAASLRIEIDYTSKWCAVRQTGLTLGSERIGYHACTADFLRGLLVSGVEIRVQRAMDDLVDEWTVIQCAAVRS